MKQRNAWLLVLVVLIALAWGCNRPVSEVPGRVELPDDQGLPKWTDQIKLSANPKLSTADCSADGGILVAESDKGLLLVRNEDGTLREVGQIDPGFPVLATALSPDGEWLAVASADALLLYATADGSLHSSVQWVQPVESVSMQISRDGLSVACIRNGYLHLYHGPYLNLRWSCRLPESNIDPVLLMSDNGLTLAVYTGGELQIFSPDAATPLWRTTLKGQFQTACISGDGVFLAVELSSESGNQLVMFERWSAKAAWEFGHQGKATSLRFSPDGIWLALTADQLYLFRGNIAQPVMQFAQPGVAALTNGQVLLIEGQMLYRFHAGEHDVVAFPLPAQLQGEFKYIYSDGEWLFALNGEGTLCLIRLPVEIA